MANITQTSVDPAIPEFWLALALGYLKANLMMARLVRRDGDSVVAEHGDTINITKRGGLTVRDKVEDTDVTADAPSNTKIAGVLDIGTQCSLVRRKSGRFVLLDTYTLTPDVERAIKEATDGGEAIDAILNLHPFHTLHAKFMRKAFPNARMIGSERHIRKAPELGWEGLRVDDPALWQEFSEDFDFTVPEGVDFISADERVHFSSVLVRHKPSGIIHSDDTLMFLRLPPPASWFGLGGKITYHPTLAKALEPRPGAAADFRTWAGKIAEEWGDGDTLCAAHSGVWSHSRNGGPPLKQQLHNALQKVEKVLAAHEKQHG